MWKTAAAGAAVLVLAGSMIVYAQQRPGFDGPRGYDAPRGYDMPRGYDGPRGYGGPRRDDGPRDSRPFGDWHPSAQDLAAFADARIAALRAGLQLNPDQEKSWPAFEQALREVAKMRIERLSARDEQPSANPIERLQRRADAMTARGTALKRVADAAAPLYQSLDDAQKRRFAMLARFMRPSEPGELMRRGRFGGGPDGDEGRGGMYRHGFHMGPHGYGHGDDYGMRNPHASGGMNGMGRDDDGDYRGPL